MLFEISKRNYNVTLSALEMEAQYYDDKQKTLHLINNIITYISEFSIARYLKSIDAVVNLPLFLK